MQHGRTDSTAVHIVPDYRTDTASLPLFTTIVERRTYALTNSFNALQTYSAFTGYYDGLHVRAWPIFL
jgi:hypothetical protein